MGFDVFRTIMVCALLLACSDPGGPGDQSLSPGVNVVSGAEQSAAIGQVFDQLLVLQVVTPDGTPAIGVAVHLSPIVVDAPTIEGWVWEEQPTMYVANPPHPPAHQPTLSVVTDQRGIASVSMRAGLVATRGGIVVDVPAIATRDTLWFNVSPGEMRYLRANPTDTSLYPGATFQVRAGVTDSHYNLTTDPVTVQPIEPGLTALGQGRFTSERYGEWRIVVSGAQEVDTLRVSFVPEGRLFATSGFRVSSFSFDGSALYSYGEFPCTGSGLDMAWNNVVGMAAISCADRLSVIGAGTAARQVVPETAGIDVQENPVFSPDGSVLYFVGRGAQHDSPTSIWSIDVNSGQLRAIVPASNDSKDDHLAPSPDGTQLAFVTYRHPDLLGHVAIVDIATGNLRYLGDTGRAVSWSPDGSLLAVLHESEVVVIRPDGTGRRVISTPDIQYFVGEGWSEAPTLDWTADGVWVLAKCRQCRGIESQGYDLINVTSGQRLSLGVLRWYSTAVIAR